jgi:dienelactone hydrolase
MKVERVAYQVANKNFVGALVYDDRASGRRPLLLMAPNWLGPTPEALKRAETMAGSRFVAFVPDMYGDGKVTAGPPEAAQLADAVRADPSERRRRISAALAALVAESEMRGIGDVSRKAAVGFCFGGGNVLELARAGADIQAVVSLHGDLASPLPAKPGDIKAALLVVHGAADPVSAKVQRDSFEDEMETAEVSWQMLTFGHLVHSFCEPGSHVPDVAEYNEEAARQSFRLVDQFIADAFEGRIVRT